MAYGDFKDLPRRIASDKILHNKAFNIAKIPKDVSHQKGLASMVYKFFDKKYFGNDVKSEIMPNQELAKEIHNSIIRKFEKRKVSSSFVDNIWGAEIQSFAKYIWNLLGFTENLDLK